MAKERLTISIDDSLVRQIDTTIDKKDIRNRSHAIETLVRQSLPSAQIDTVIVFIGGEGIKGIVSFIHSSLKNLEGAGMRRCHIIYGHYGQEIKDDLNLSDLNIVTTYHQTEQGSAGGLREIADLLPAQFGIINVQKPIKFNWPSLISYHNQYNPTVTLTPHDLNHLQGIGIAQKTIIEAIPIGFSVLEEESMQALLALHRLMLVPNLIS